MPASAAVAAEAPTAPGHIWIRTPPMPSALNPRGLPRKVFCVPFPWHSEQLWKNTKQAWWSEIKMQRSAWQASSSGNLDPPQDFGGSPAAPTSHLCLSHPAHNVAIGSTSAPHPQGQKDPRNFPSVLPFSASTPADVPSSKHCFPIQSSHLQPIPPCSSVPGLPSHPYLTLSTTHSQKKLQTYRRLTKDKEPANVLLPFQTKQSAGAEGFCLG